VKPPVVYLDVEVFALLVLLIHQPDPEVWSHPQSRGSGAAAILMRGAGL